jgi:hypothetical protein
LKSCLFIHRAHAVGLREVGYPALILYPKRAFGIIDFDPLEYTIECELVMLTINAKNAAGEVQRYAGKRS